MTTTTKHQQAARIRTLYGKHREHWSITKSIILTAKELGLPASLVREVLGFEPNRRPRKYS